MFHNFRCRHIQQKSECNHLTDHPVQKQIPSYLGLCMVGINVDKPQVKKTGSEGSTDTGIFQWYCWWKKSCTSWYVVYSIIYKVYVSQVVQDFFHQQYESIIMDMETNQTFEDFKCLCVCVLFFLGWTCFFQISCVQIWETWLYEYKRSNLKWR